MTWERNRNRVTTIAVALLVAGSLVAAAAGALAAHPAATERTVTERTGATGEPAAMQETTTAEQADVSLRNFSAPSRVRAGQNYTVSATLANRRSGMVVQTVSYRITGNVIESRLVRIAGDATETVTFNVSGDQTRGLPTGTFVHGVYAGTVQTTANLTIVADGETTEATTTIAPATTAETTTADEQTTTQAPAASVEFENQTSNGTVVTVRSVTVPDGGFVVVHDRRIVEGNVNESLRGVSAYLESGTHENVSVRLDESLNESREVVAVVYRDSNENETFDFLASGRTEDAPYVRPGSSVAVNDFAVVTVEDAGETTTQE